MLSPKKTGIIASVFFVTVYMIDSCQIFRSAALEYTFVITLIVIPSVMGAIASYMYFCKAKIAKMWAMLIFLASLWGIMSQS